MNIKKFTADTTREALQMVKREMGPEAVILRTRTLRGPGQSDTGKRFEVTAAVDYDPSPEQEMSVKALGGDMEKVLEGWRHLKREIREIKEALLSADAGVLLRPEVYFNEALRSRFVNYRTFGLHPEVIRGLMEGGEGNGETGKTSNAELLQESLAKVLSRIQVEGGGSSSRERKIFAFLGPTGVGKTTTLAKLAAIRAIKQGKRAALVTLDTFRIAAVAQLQSYARIMGIPLEVAVNRSGLEAAIHKHRQCDLILIDTAGRSPNQEEAVGELKDLLSIPEDIHGYLVLSATAQYGNLLHADRRFGELPFKSYIFTKLDETQDTSSMINFLISRQKPVSYFTTGQQVPEDIETASRKKLATLLLARMRETGENPTNEVDEYGSSYWT